MWVLGWIVGTGCSNTEIDTQGEPEVVPEEYAAPEGGVITLETRDGVALVAKNYPAETEGRPAVVLLHMVPPSWDRSSWPTSFIGLLQAHDWSVLVVDRRGAGDSEGVATEAYEGEKGRYDVEACTKKLAEDGAGPLAIIGASNGTASALDYTLWARGEGLTEPVALGFMTGGSYTEKQSAMSSLTDGPPAIFTFSTAERAWSVAQEPGGPSTWVFHEYAAGDHGTKMFDAAPEVAADLDAFLEALL